LCAGIRERRLSRQQVQNGADAGPVPTQGYFAGLLRAGHEITGSSDPPGRGLQRMVRAENLEHDLLTEEVRPGGRRIGLGRGLTFVVNPREAGEEWDAKTK
jgi:hypothetical protein